MITEYTCNYKKSLSLFKQLSELNLYVRILKVNPVFLSHVNPTNKNLFILNLECENSTEFLRKSNQLNYFASPYKWLIFHSKPLNETIEKNFKNLDILIDSDVTLCQNLHNDTVAVTKIFKYRSNYPIEIENAGYWTKNGGYNDLDMEKIAVRRRRNMKGATLNTCVVVTNNDTLNHLTDKRDKHIDSITKVDFVLVNHLGDIVNATLNFSFVSSWGYKMNDSHWNGMLGCLERKEADIGGTALFFVADRLDVIEYIAMVTPTKSKFVFRAPKLSYVTNVFTLPFDRQVWISTFFLVILIGLLINYILKWEIYKKKSENETSYALQKVDQVEVALISFGAVCQQSSTVIPTSIPGRITTILLFISLMFLYTSYSANIVALLQSSSSGIRTLEDLLKSRLQIGVFDTVYNRHYFPKAKGAVRRAIYEQKVAPRGQKDHFMPLEEGVRKIREGLFAFHMETGVGYKVIGEIYQEYEKCDLQEIQYYDFTDPHIAIQKNSPYRKLFKIGFRKIWESGLQPREVNLIYTKKPTCTSRNSSFINVGLVDCYAAIMVLVVGVIISLLIWLLELIFHKRSLVKQRAYDIKNYPKY
ncbi:ionotropic receptor 75a-like [Diorhabda sublineata]|uniref:ionotropic receptor 75a-like n=1 Tax=Diorhabda sublineata TaxID=1163346 RepID=UPI0024E158B2|nr:ionotropic receptor 75a-like [Diorhabda sublineata]